MNNNNNITNFNTRKNKELLWKLMYENGLFKNIDNSLSERVQLFFEKKINIIDTQKTNTDTLTTLNKQVINEMMLDIKGRKYIIDQATAAVAKTMPLEQMITAQEIQQNRQTVFDQQFKNMKNEFDSLIQVPKPEVIDFSDNKRKTQVDTINSTSTSIADENMDIERLLAETISKRENLVITIGENEKKNASKWINNNREVQIPAQSPAQAQPANRILKIGEEIDADIIINPDRLKKNVSFDIPVVVDDDSIKEMNTRINEINEKLNKITEMLFSIKEYQQQAENNSSFSSSIVRDYEPYDQAAGGDDAGGLFL